MDEKVVESLLLLEVELMETSNCYGRFTDWWILKSLLLLEVELMETSNSRTSTATEDVYRFYYWKWN